VILGILIACGICFGLPFLTFLTVKAGTYGYYRAKALAKRKEVEPR